MKKLNDLEYLKLSKFEAFLYKLKLFLCEIPLWFVNLGKLIWGFIKKCGLGIKDEFVDIFTTFTKGNWAVKLSFLIFRIYGKNIIILKVLSKSLRSRS